jgi:broad specificity phosphatase PhoE
MQTFEQLCVGSTSSGTTTMTTTDAVFAPENVTVTEDIAEWDYGDYEGITEGETRVLRKERGWDVEREWDVWRDGCEGGE